MEKGWGLTLDSDSLALFHSSKRNIFAPTTTADHQSKTMFSSLDFPAAKLGRREDHVAPPPPSDENRAAAAVVDFFSDKNRLVNDGDNTKSTATVLSVKKENSHGDNTSTRPSLDVNVSLSIVSIIYIV